MTAVLEDFIYPVRLYTRVYCDDTDYAIEGDANSTTPLAQNLEHADDAGTFFIKAGLIHAEKRDTALERARSLVREDREGCTGSDTRGTVLSTPTGMPEVYLPDAQSEGMRAEVEREIIVRVALWLGKSLTSG